jgi:hypothetical protein
VRWQAGLTSLIPEISGDLIRNVVGAWGEHGA